jgi:hypothetical protein
MGLSFAKVVKAITTLGGFMCKINKEAEKPEAWRLP